jgi:hypothetical protein
MQAISGFNSLKSQVEGTAKKESAPAKSSTSYRDTASISDASKVFSQVDHVFNLGNPRSVDTGSMSPADRKEFIKIVANLLHKGVVGYEILNVNGRPEKHFIENEIGDTRIKGTKLYNNGKDDGN